MRTVRLLALIIAALALASCGGGGDDGGEGGGASPPSADIVPATAALYVSIDTNLDSGQWQTVSDLIDKFPDGDRLVGMIEREFEEEEDVDFQTDVRPALGDEVAIVMLDVEGGEDSLVGLTQPKDEAKFERLLAEGDDETVSTEVDGWTVFAEEQATLDRFRDARAGDSLADAPRFAEALEGLAAERLLVGYVDGPAVRTALDDALEDFGTPAQLGGIQGFDTLQWAAFAVAAEENGVGFEADVRTAETEVTGYEPALLDRIPGDALAVVSFNGETSERGLDETLRELRTKPAGAMLEQFERQLGISVDQIAPLFAREGALYARQATPIPEVTLASTVDDEEQAMRTVDRLLTRAGTALGSAPRPDPTAGVAGAKVVSLGPVSVRYASFDGTLVVTTGANGMEAFRSEGGKLADDDDFARARERGGMPEETTGFFYVDLREAIAVARSLAALAGEDDQIPPIVTRNLEPLQSFLAYGSADGVQTFAAFLELE